MREKRSLDKEQLPESDYEVWLHSQKSREMGKKHSTPSEDIYEAWIRKRVESLGRATRRGTTETRRQADR